MKKIIAFCLITFTCCPLFARDSLEETTAFIKEVRYKYATSHAEKPYKDTITEISLKTSVDQVYGLLEGKRARILEKECATPEARIKALGSLFQNQIVEKRLNKKFHEIDLSHAQNSPGIKEHLAALWIMTRGVRAFIDTPELGPHPQDMLLYLKARSEPLPDEVKKFLTLEAISILFPEGFFKHLLTYAYQFKDYMNQQKLFLSMEKHQIVISATIGFATPQKEPYKMSSRGSNLLHPIPFGLDAPDISEATTVVFDKKNLDGTYYKRSTVPSTIKTLKKDLKKTKQENTEYSKKTQILINENLQLINENNKLSQKIIDLEKREAEMKRLHVISDEKSDSLFIFLSL